MRRNILILLSLIVAAAMARAADEPRAAEATGDDVRVRAGPAMKHGALLTLAKGDLVVVVGEEGLWKRVLVPGGVACFVHASLVRRDPGGEATIIADHVLLRPTAGKEQLPLETVLKKGDALVVLGEEGEWLKVIPPDRTHLYVYSELLKDLGPAAEYRQRIEAVTALRREALVSGRSLDALRADREARQKSLREEALRLGEQVLSGEGETADLRRRIDHISLEAEDELTVSYANALLALLAQRQAAERMRRELATAEGEKSRSAEELSELRGRMEAAEKEYETALAKARELRVMRESVYQAVGVVEMREGGFVLVERGRVVYRIESERFRLADYAGRRVAVSGRRIVEDAESGAGRLMVEKLEILPGEPVPR